jgi:hypothetical protein
MHIHVLCYIKSFHGCFMQICMLVMPGMSDAMFLVNMLCLEKNGLSDFCAFADKTV